jgi:hypothetical protein
MISYTRKILYTPTPDKDNRMFLKIMPDAGNVCRYFSA